MKNLHLLPTEKPSRLYLFEERLILGDLVTVVFKNSGAVNQNIYITSEEEIKERDWFITDKNTICKCIRVDWKYAYSIEAGSISKNNCKKIILTTDQDLIKDGVQAIDYEFLEWFVKNPSCERIEVNGISDVALGGFADVCYKIIIPRTTEQIINEDYAGGLEMGQIIPKEEPKQETQGYICPHTKLQCDDECCVSASDCHIKTTIGILSEPKQETLDLLNKLVELNKTSIKEKWKMSEVGEQFFKIFAYNHVK